MNASQPERVTPADISSLLDQLRALPPGASLMDKIAYHEQKAQMLSAIAAELGTTEAHDVAARAWEQLSALARRLGETVNGGAR